MTTDRLPAVSRPRAKRHGVTLEQAAAVAVAEPLPLAVAA